MMHHKKDWVEKLGLFLYFKSVVFFTKILINHLVLFSSPPANGPTKYSTCPNWTSGIMER